MIPHLFINHASNVLGETHEGLSGAKIVEYCSAYAIDFDVDIPHPTYPFSTDLPNKRTALRENLSAFSPEQQYIIIKNLCDLPQFSENKSVKDLKIKLITRYDELDETGEKISEPLIESTKHWLSDYPESLKLFDEALAKFNGDVFQRNTLDDLRLSLEVLLKNLLGNDKSLENQLGPVGTYVKENGGSKELVNMFVKLLDYFSKYHNTFIKHNDSVVEAEVEIMFEMTSSFMKFLIRIG